MTMDSLSKGIFVFPNGAGKKQVKIKSLKFRIGESHFEYEKDSLLWNEQFEKSWQNIQTQVETLQTTSNEKNYSDIINFIEEANEMNQTETAVSTSTYVPVAALLTGINKPDHQQYFKTLSDKIKLRFKTHMAMLPARDCPNIKSAIEVLVSSILNGGNKRIYDWDEENINRFTKPTETNDSFEESGEESTTEGDGDEEPPIKLRKSQYTINVLQSWYSNRYANTSIATSKPKLIIIVPNFEEFKASVIQDLILILSNHIDELPFVLILGVATSMSSIFHTLSFSETTRIKLRKFASQSPIIYLNQILEDIILTPRATFHLSNKLFAHLTDVFLFYDLTTTEFMKSFKFCMLEHYSQGDAYAACAPTYTESLKIMSKLTDADVEVIRRLPSFRPFVESLTDYAEVIEILTNNEYFRKKLITLIADIYKYFFRFHCCLRILLLLVKDLPGAPLGKCLRDIYSKCVSGEGVTESPEFQKCWQMLEFMSKSELIAMFEKCCLLLAGLKEQYCSENIDDLDHEHTYFLNESIETIKSFICILLSNKTGDQTYICSPGSSIDLKTFDSRHSMQMKMLELARQNKAENSEEMKNVLKSFKNEFLGRNLLPFKKGPTLIELFVFSDYHFVRQHLRGAPKGAIYRALRNPHEYLQCECCFLDNNTKLLPTMPDISVAFKLLEECGQHVNLFDWLQSFQCVVDNTDFDEISAVTQAKFTRARAELQFLGFIKNSKRKTDHVTRTTW